MDEAQLAAWREDVSALSRKPKPAVASRNIDADSYFDEVSKPVVGWQKDPGAIHVDGCPEVGGLPIAAEIRDIGRQE